MCAPRPFEPRQQSADPLGRLFADHAAAFASSQNLSPDQAKALGAMAACRTARLGGYLYTCDHCGHEVPLYASCRNRHCPRCQDGDQDAWTEARLERMLPVGHHHIVFTLPQELRVLARHAPKETYGILMRSAGRAIAELCRSRLGFNPGITVALHTWRRDLGFHPHVHCMVSHGGLSVEGPERWVEPPSGLLLPLEPLRALIRGKVMGDVDRAWRAGKLRLEGHPLDRPDRWADVRDRAWRRKWVIFEDPPRSEAARLVRYLGRYTRRVGIANSRVVDYDGERITFRTRGDKTVTLTAEHFLGRLLRHVLPSGFRKTRHYALYAPANTNGALARARALLVGPEGGAAGPTGDAAHLDEVLAEIDAQGPIEGDAWERDDRPLCPVCRVGRMTATRLARAPAPADPWDTS